MGCIFAGGLREESRNSYENWARQLSPFLKKALAFYQHPELYSRSLYIVSNDLGVLDRAAPVWKVLGPRNIELYSINEKGQGAFKNNPAGYVRADLSKYGSLAEFMAYARKLPWMDEGWQSPAVFISHMKQFPAADSLLERTLQPGVVAALVATGA